MRSVTVLKCEIELVVILQHFAHFFLTQRLFTALSVNVNLESGIRSMKSGVKIIASAEAMCASEGISHHALDGALIEQPHSLFRVVIELLEDEIRVETALNRLS
uniref:Uncharacterized protein n=1 Tax=Pristionchus pacificus TaxID=54126 RepID=A0A2A6BCQ8_PRIPA|eukprot:PDM63672.1 hypothetical protein PRIPAC_49645 [Pristionchus pacificus]